jgi:hypothetical protein
LSRFSIAYLVSSRDFLIGMICIERVLSSSAETSTNVAWRVPNGVDPLIDRTAQQAEAGSVGDVAIDVQDPSDVRRLAASSSRGVIYASQGL